MFKTNTKFKIANTSTEYLADDAQDVICNIDNDFGQFGVYKISNNSLVYNNCEVETLLEPKNVFTRKYYSYKDVLFDRIVAVSFTFTYLKNLHLVRSTNSKELSLSLIVVSE